MSPGVQQVNYQRHLWWDRQRIRAMDWATGMEKVIGSDPQVISVKFPEFSTSHYLEIMIVNLFFIGEYRVKHQVLA